MEKCPKISPQLINATKENTNKDFYFVFKKVLVYGEISTKLINFTNNFATLYQVFLAEEVLLFFFRNGSKNQFKHASLSSLLARETLQVHI